jgi:hypothetical protein
VGPVDRWESTPFKLCYPLAVQFSLPGAPVPDPASRTGRMRPLISALTAIFALYHPKRHTALKSEEFPIHADRGWTNTIRYVLYSGSEIHEPLLSTTGSRLGNKKKSTRVSEKRRRCDVPRTQNLSKGRCDLKYLDWTVVWCCRGSWLKGRSASRLIRLLSTSWNGCGNVTNITAGKT